MFVVNINTSAYDVYGSRRQGSHMNNTEPGKPGWLGNPVPMSGESHREECVQEFKKLFWKKLNEDRAFVVAVLELRGLRVGCYCAPKTCHLNVVHNFLEWTLTRTGKEWLEGWDL